MIYVSVWKQGDLIGSKLPGIKNSPTVAEKPIFYRPRLCYSCDKYINIHHHITAVSLEPVSQQSYISGRT